jgi:hypothetical protein
LTKSAKRKPNGKHEPVHAEVASADAPTNIITYEDAVREAKEILARHDEDWTRLGALADQVDTHYGQKKLQKWAEAIDIAYCTAKRHRDVYRFCKKIEDELAPLGRFSYSVLRELASDPEAAKIILKESPKLKRREAREKLREYRENKKDGKGQENKKHGKRQEDKKDKRWKDLIQNNKRWFRQVQRLANDAIGHAKAIVDARLTADQERMLVAAIEPKLLPDLRKGGERLVQLADYLEKLKAWAEEETTQEHAARTARAAESTDNEEAADATTPVG